jgi:hypothetical protein
MGMDALALPKNKLNKDASRSSIRSRRRRSSRRVSASSRRKEDTSRAKDDPSRTQQAYTTFEQPPVTSDVHKTVQHQKTRTERASKFRTLAVDNMLATSALPPL